MSENHTNGYTSEETLDWPWPLNTMGDPDSDGEWQPAETSEGDIVWEHPQLDVAAESDHDVVLLSKVHAGESLTVEEHQRYEELTGASGELPRRFDAGDGDGEFVYKRRGMMGRSRARFHRLKDTWLEVGVPTDPDEGLDETSLTHRLAGTPVRKLTTGIVAMLIMIITMLLVVGRVAGW